MAAREFHAVLRNGCDSELVLKHAHCDGGEFQLHPNDGAARIASRAEGKFSSESDGIMTGTSGWCRWSVRVSFPQPHTEFVQINWSVPYVGGPHITFGVFRSDPDDSFGDRGQPDLEMGVVGWNEADSNSFLDDLPYVALYTSLIPFSFFSGARVSTKPRVQWLVRPRAGTSRGAFTFAPTPRFTEGQQAAASFRHRADVAARQGFAGGFPNFFVADRPAGAQVGGTIFVKAPAAQWRDVPWRDLGKPGLDDFGARMRASHDYAVRRGFVSGFPTFHHAGTGEGTVCGTVLLGGDVAEWRDVSLLELGRPGIGDIGGRFRKTQEYATRNGFVGGYPNMYHRAEATPRLTLSPVCGTILLRQPFAEWQDVQTRGPIG